jgi:hypothetical protein
MAATRTESTETEAGDQGRLRRGLSALFTRFPRARAMLVLTFAVLMLNGLTIRAQPPVSAVDEREHIDHLVTAAQGHIPQGGRILTQETLRELCSRGSEYIKWPRCKPGRLNPADYAVAGVNAAGDEPFYYLVNGPAAWTLKEVVPGSDSVVTWGRLFNSVWLLLGFYLVLRAADRLGISRARTVLALLLVAALPVQLFATTTVTPDATSFVAGAGVLLAALAWEQTGRRAWLLATVAVAAAAVVTKSTNGVAVLLVFVYFLLRALGAARESEIDAETKTKTKADVEATPEPAAEPSLPRSWRQYVVFGVLVVGGMAVGTLGWKEAQKHRASPTPQDYNKAVLASAARLDPLRAEPTEVFKLTGRMLFGHTTVFAMFPPIREPAPPIRRSVGPHATWYQDFVSAASFLVIGALLLGILRLSFADRGNVLALATTITLLIAPTLMVAYRWYVDKTFDPIVERFGLSALPAVALVVAAVTKERLAQVALAVVSIGLFATAVYTAI